MNSQEICEKIKNDIKEEFLRIQDELKVHLTGDFDIEIKKEFLIDHVPKEIMVRSELLLDTLLNYLMEHATSILQKSDIELQNTFFNQNFRNRYKEWAKKIENQLILEPAHIEFSKDPRWFYGGVTAGTTVVIGSAITAAIASSFAVASVAGAPVGAPIVFIPSGVIMTIIAGIATLIAAALAFKFAFEKASPLSRKTVVADVDQYLKSSEQQVLDWLQKVNDAFVSDFKEFCNSNAFSLRG